MTLTMERLISIKYYVMCGHGLMVSDARLLIDCLKRADTERDKYRVALEKIANEDYRGNRPYSATIAFEALKG